MYDKPYRRMYGEVVELNIAKRKPFPDSRMKGILENTAKTANEIMTLQSFAGRRRKNVWNNRNRSG